MNIHQLNFRLNNRITNYKKKKLYNKNKDKEVTVAANGRVNDGEEDLSIHKMSAKMSGLANNNGWSYFLVKNDDGEFATLDSLRYRFQEENGL